MQQKRTAIVIVEIFEKNLLDEKERIFEKNLLDEKERKFGEILRGVLKCLKEFFKKFAR